MKLKNNALQELYETIVNGTFTFSPYAASPIDKAFKKCDEKIQKDIDFWKCGNEILHSANMDLVNYKQKLEKEIDGLKEHVLENHKIITNISSERDALEKERDNLLSRTHYAEDEVERLRKAHDELFVAGSRKISELRRENEAVNKKLEEEVEELKESLEKVNTDRTELQKDRDFYHGLYTELRKDYDKLSEESKQISELRRENAAAHMLVGIKNEEIQALKGNIDYLKNQLDKANSDRMELKKDRDIWVRNNGEKQAEIAELKRKLEAREEELDAWTRKHLETTTQFDELKSQYQKLSIENKRLQYDYNTLHRKYSECQGIVDKQAEQIRHLKAKQDSVRKNCYDQGQTDLWDKLQTVKDMKPEKFDPECETLGDIIDMDLEDFLDAYEKWQEERKKVAEEAKKKHIEYMRDYLKRYCRGRWCANCPIHNIYEPVTSCLFSRLTDEEVEKRYRTVIESNNKNIPTPIIAWPPRSWECSIEAKVEINKDLLEKVCGIKLDEEEHKLEYGDAVRLPWRDYDYMYIGPDEKEETLVRMFDPKNHAIATTHIGNVRYNGGKIIIADEEDLRKIWEAKK